MGTYLNFRVFLNKRILGILKVKEVAISMSTFMLKAIELGGITYLHWLINLRHGILEKILLRPNPFFLVFEKVLGWRLLKIW